MESDGDSQKWYWDIAKDPEYDIKKVH